MKYRFFLTDSSNNTREVFPLDFVKAKLQRKRDLSLGQIFYRTKMTGQLVFTNDDYNYLLAIEQNNSCEPLYIRIEMQCSDGWQELWTGIFTTRKGRFDLDRCTFAVQPEPYDRYTCILSELERKINILDNPETVTTSTFVLADYEYFICRCEKKFEDGFGSGTQIDVDFCLSECKTTLPAPQQTWKPLFGFGGSGNATNSNGEAIQIYFRERIVTACIAGVPQPPPSGTGWELLDDDCANSGNAVWVRQPELSNFGINQSDKIQAGLCTGSFGTIEELPPPQLRLQVEFDKTKVVPVINGYNMMLSSGVFYPHVRKYKVLNRPPQSTTVWSDILNPFSNYTVLSSNDDEIVIQFTGFCYGELRARYDYNSGGSSQTAIMKIGSTSVNGAVNESKILGQKYLCTGQHGVRYESATPITGTNAQYQNTPWSVGISQGGAFSGNIGTIISGGAWNDDYVVVDFPPDYEGEVIISKNGTAFYSTINKHPYTGNESTYYHPYRGIIGNAYAEAGTQPNLYKVYPRAGSTYNWEVIGGVILSGQGTNQIEVEWGNGTDGVVFVKETLGSNCCQWIQIIPCGSNGEPPYYWCGVGQQNIYTRNRWLLGTIEYMANHINCPNGYTLVSDFFEWNPVGDTNGYAPGINYVTGQVNQVNLLTISAKSDVRLPNASNPATIANWTLAEAFTALREMFQAWWFIDDAGRLRIEHIKAFTYPVSLDLTLWPKETRALNKYTHEETNIPKFERFRFMEAGNTDFIGVDIWYDSICVNQKEDEQVLEHVAPNITTDIEYIYTNPNDISNTGFVIMANIPIAGGYEVITDIGALSGATSPNAPLSWANLHEAFHKQWRFLRKGYMNNQLTDFEIQPNIKGQPIEIPFCCEFITYDPKYRIITPLGNILSVHGFLEQAEFSFLKQTTIFTISYPY